MRPAWGLWKDLKSNEVRPIGIGGSLRRLLCKAYAAGLKKQFADLVGDHQLVVHKAGYEVGVHSMRQLINQAKEKGHVIMFLDFENAFNCVDRNLFMTLCAAHMPELAQLAFWLYSEEPRLYTARGDRVKSSAGAQQGCILSGILFSLVIRYIFKKIKTEDLNSIFFLDDGALIGTPESVAQAAKAIDALREETGLKLRWDKCKVYTRDNDAATLASPLFEVISGEIEVHANFWMTYLKVPLGPDAWVQEQLREKLRELETLVEKLSGMPYRHEAFTLMRSCADRCKVTHLMRTLPPRQSEPFIRQYDQILRSGFEQLINCLPGELNDVWWRQAKLPPKFGGMGLRSGVSTLGAQHTISLLITAPMVTNIVGQKQKSG